jgi:D-alanyl-D-alanine carboxypeptidase/D-alanyl-D-alanine-endopeptidase (penicillin-binding protein 4)
MPVKSIIAIITIVFSIKAYGQTTNKQVVIEETFLPLISKSDSAHSIKALSRDIDNILNKSNLGNTDYGVMVYSISDKKVLYAKHESKPLTPASTTKIVTSFITLNLLKNLEIVTPIYHNGKISNGTIYGDIIIYGQGDPLLTQGDIDSVARVIKNKGIKLITGNVYVDNSYFDSETSRFKYSRDDDVVEEVGPITPLSIERNKALITVRASNSGAYLDCDVYPISETLKYLVYAKTTGYNQYDNGRDNYVEPLVRQKYGDAYNNDLATNDDLRLSIGSELNDENAQIFIIRGTLRKGRSRAYRYYMKDPAIAAGGVLKSSLERAGVKVLGGVEVCTLNSAYNKPKYTLAYIKRDIFQVLDELNKHSDNYIAENLFKIIGAHNKKYSDNYHGARDLTYRILDSLNIPYEGVSLNDGSGLSRRNLLTPKTLVSILEYVYHQKYGEKFIASLPIAGEDGTLRNRMGNTAAEDVLIGKTGTLRHTSALAGITTSLDSDKLAYAFIFNGNDIGKFKSVENELGELISQFFYFNEEH